MLEPSTTSERTKIRNHPERAAPEATADILSQGMVAHVGFIQDDYPVVIPMSYHYSSETPERLYLHGSIRSRLLKHLASGASVCVAVTLTDGLVYSRKAMNHSMNYRSAVVFGEAREIVDEGQKFALFDQMVQRYFPGRTVDHDYHAPPSQDLGVTSLIEVTLKDWSGKIRQGGPTAPEDDDPNALGSSGVIDLREV
ncbi:MAG: pyridoxamine 5'-phosphate oxidase family protein [Chloroflexi bacterium]|nr:pyridoxamine 5'-phosphate oxidase family protein [Chloroflexota bacterium]MDA1220111.1 pyridoxamine 5'-phosphate oxidase family protein [Chloroflexota bacterium]